MESRRCFINAFFCFFIPLLLILSGCGGVQSATGKAIDVENHKPVVKIGIVIPLSGSMAFMGESVRDAAMLAKESLGSTKYEYELVFEDDQINPKLTSTAANKLMNVDGVDAIVTYFSGAGNVVSPMATENKVIHFGIASDANIAKGGYNFIHWTTPGEEAKVWAEEADRRGVKRVSAVLMNSQGVFAIHSALKAELGKRGIEVVAEEVFETGDKDFKVQLMKAAAAKPDIYILEAFSPDLELLGRQIAELGIDGPVSAIESFEYTEEKSLFEGSWYVNAADFTAEFSDSYQARFGKLPLAGAANVYDIVNMLAYSFEKVGDGKSLPSDAQVVAVLDSIRDFDSAMGKISMGENGIVESKAVVRMVKDGELVTIG